MRYGAWEFTSCGATIIHVWGYTVWGHEGLVGTDILFQVWLQEGWVRVDCVGAQECQGKPRSLCATAWAYSWYGKWAGRTQRNPRVPQPQPRLGNNNNKGRRNQQEEPNSGPDLCKMLTQVLQLLQNLPLDPPVKEQLQDSLQGHVAPMLQPKKSRAELIHEKQT